MTAWPAKRRDASCKRSRIRARGGVRAGGMPPVKCKLLIANSHLSSVTVSVTASRCYAMNAMGLDPIVGSLVIIGVGLSF